MRSKVEVINETINYSLAHKRQIMPLLLFPGVCCALRKLKPKKQMSLGIRWHHPHVSVGNTINYHVLKWICTEEKLLSKNHVRSRLYLKKKKKKSVEDQCFNKFVKRLKICIHPRFLIQLKEYTQMIRAFLLILFQLNIACYLTVSTVWTLIQIQERC